MHLARLKLRDFRNIRRLDVEFEPGFHVLLGRNAQGKTNLLEAVYLLATLRSFRGVGNAQIIRHERKAFFAGGLAIGQAENDIRYYWSAAQRKLTVNEKPIRRVADYLGALRTVIFCTEDSLLVNGPAKSRRRFLDLLLTQTRPGYLDLLHRYTEALRSRNALLKRDSPDLALLDSFTSSLSPPARNSSSPDVNSSKNSRRSSAWATGKSPPSRRTPASTTRQACERILRWTWPSREAASSDTERRS